MNTYRLYELHDEHFEQLVVQICIQVLGTGTFSFAPGKDGGRDGRFTGTAQAYPSVKSPLKGKFVIQAKHTRNGAASCSDRDFTRILKQELPRIAALVKTGELEHYLLFTNRRLTGIKDAQVRQRLLNVPNLKTSDIFGRETITSYLVGNRKIWRELGFDRDETPFRINPTDLVAVIQNFHSTVKASQGIFKSATNFTHVKKQKKNTINKLSEEYYEYIQRESLPHFDRIKRFLEDSRNEPLRAMYHDAADDLKGKIITFRERFSSFDEILTYLYDEILAGGTVGAGQKRLVKIFLHYMYFDCDIGRHA
jgi:C-terminal domain 12 of the ABC-three component (ABC-3C) systems